MAQAQLKWILQSNLIKESVVEEIKKALRLDNVGFEDVKIIPFSDELPSIQEPAAFNIFYGSTTLIFNAYKNPRFKNGVFFDTEKFQIKTYIKEWGSNVLNFDSRITTFKAFSIENHAEESEWFIRPNDDDKSFTGTIMTFQKVREFANDLRESNNPHLTAETLITVSSPKKIDKEWRHFIVKGKVISSSRYINKGATDISRTDVPVELIQFVEASCSVFTPHDIFVMDTALFNGKYFILECNCFNGTGFYDHDIIKIVREVNGHVSKALSEKLSV